MEQILTCLLAEMNAMREEMGSYQKHMTAEMKTGQEEMIAKMDTWIEGTMTCIGKLEANPEEI
jgi:hypothetical protein